MNVCFTLTMPNRASWNGRWSGEDRFYAVIEKFRDTKKHRAKARELLEKGSWYYRWDDGWGAIITAKEVTPAEARTIRRKSNGFCGYEWMIKSILNYGAIYADHQIPGHMGTQQAMRETEQKQACEAHMGGERK